MPLGMYSIRSMPLISQKTIAISFWADGSVRASFVVEILCEPIALIQILFKGSSGVPNSRHRL